MEFVNLRASTLRRCTVSTDLKTAGLWTEGSLQSCVNLATGAARNQGQDLFLDFSVDESDAVHTPF